MTWAARSPHPGGLPALRNDSRLKQVRAAVAVDIRVEWALSRRRLRQEGRGAHGE